MELRASNILCHEILGLRARVEDYPDPSFVGAEGRVTWETERSVEIELPGGRVKLLKVGLTLALLVRGEWIKVKGESLGNPVERAKKIMWGECSARA
ncbi:MAG: ribonuclease P protein subunit [Acidilobaceae archaeon]|nr:ribonuclease P protein subunit [Acidilobaceae archaeon]MCX8166051.1 ribonuclease P protein subunit [Acidilobaceae archaeon]MDW7974694.1 ribonuclease P protein subunit [Sulfolobales archaeon]